MKELYEKIELQQFIIELLIMIILAGIFISLLTGFMYVLPELILRSLV